MIYYPRRRRRIYRRKVNYKKKSLVTVDRLKRYIKTSHETKYYTRANFGATIDYNAATAGGSSFVGTYPMLLNTVVQGTAFDQRIGNSIKCQKLTFNYMIQNGSTLGVDLVRVIIFWARYASGVLSAPALGQVSDPTFADLLITTGGPQSPQSEYNWSQKAKWHILYDRCHMLVNNSATHAITGPGVSVGTAPYVSVRRSINLKGRETEFDNNTTNADQMKGALCLFIVSNNASATANKPIVNFASTLHFKDS